MKNLWRSRSRSLCLSNPSRLLFRSRSQGYSGRITFLEPGLHGK
ncbi:MAG: hypothetical protein AAGA60_21175 [Cyanobacteria bacterium P01_E01_bin.42]